MALPDYSFLVAGTAFTWKSSGGTYTLTLTSIANDGGREGVKTATLVDGTLGMPEILEILFESQVQAAPTNGKEIELWFGESDSATAGTNNPGNLTGADAALTTPDELKQQCNFAGSIVLSNNRGTNVQKQRFRYAPLQPYLIPVVVNKSGQTLGATAGNHVITVTPFYRKLAD